LTNDSARGPFYDGSHDGGVENAAMATAKEYRKFAEECLRWADEADTEQDRTALLELARDWTLAAQRLELASPRNVAELKRLQAQ
jgi:hypothetical protein